MAENHSTVQFEVRSSVRGYHVYMSTWRPVPGEELHCTREQNNIQHRYSVAVAKDGSTVGHLPRKISVLSRVHNSKRVSNAHLAHRICFRKVYS